MMGHLDGFGVKELTLDEGNWLLDHDRKKDWGTLGVTMSEAILTYFGVHRATEGLSAKRMAMLKLQYPHLFQ